MSCDEIPMDILFSESGESCSTAPTSPSASPLFRPSDIDDLKLALPESTPPTEEHEQVQPVKNVCVVGAGYVGGPTAAILALHNPAVTVEVLDRDPQRIKQWKSPHLPVHEPGLDHLVRVVRDGVESDESDIPRRQRNLYFTSDSARVIAKADIIFMAVNTPTKMFGVGAGCATNMAAFDGAMRDVAAHAKPGAIIVEKSTVPGGTADRVRKMLAAHRPGASFEVLSNPEFLAEGTAIKNLTTPDRVLIGSAATPAGRQAARTLANLYKAWIPADRILETNTWSSELAKLVANAMLAQRISSINSVSAICERTGADVDQVAKAIGMDARIGSQFLKAGLGFGGSCFRKDIASLAYLAESLGLDDVAMYWRQVNIMNERQRDRFARKVIERFEGNLVGHKLAILGFAFKKNTGDTRESLAVEVIRLLLDERPAEITIFDPYCRQEDIMRELGPGVAEMGTVKVHSDPYLACSQAHAILVVTDCDQFRNTATKKSSWSISDQSTHTSSSDCMDFQPTSQSGTNETIEWPRIAYNMVEPKWVFDGRGLLDVVELKKLGVRVDRVGRRTELHV
ncbi:hypothetical protein N7494_010320 [Penicillium frequentans]|uniref:UDP-glucose 6-dehydrogenase n=1 Tax=Penicillium frequentans TaxID=3151616 RepID=A0AAD6G9N3_9EURO|nr:hypothetical protein N7494_010320 [Penicillium glabrum]